MKKVFIHAGHGGNDPGAIGPTGLKEKDVNLKLALKVEKILKGYGYQVIQARTNDKTLDSRDAVAEANRVKADILVSIHNNSATSPAATGTETYLRRSGGYKEQSRKLAQSIQESLVKAIKLPDRGVKEANFAVIARANMPAALIEVAFINNPREERLLKDENFLDNAASGIAEGIIKYLGGGKGMETKIKMKVKGKEVTLRGLNVKNTNYVSVRDLAEILGYKVGWDNKTKTVIIDD